MSSLPKRNAAYEKFFFNEGRIASIDGENLDTNPYTPDSIEFENFYGGWYYQEAQDMTAEENRKRIAVHLEVHGPTSAADLEKALHLTKGKVWQALKDKRFKQGHAAKWMMSDATEIKPINVIQHLCVIEQLDKQIQDCQNNVRDYEKAIEKLKQEQMAASEQIKTLQIVKNYHEGQLNEHAQTPAKESAETPRR